MKDRTSSLDALSAAGEQYAQTKDNGRINRRRPGLAWPIFVALAVGASLVFAQRFHYRCVAALRVTGDPSARRCAMLHKELSDYISRRYAPSNDRNMLGQPWSVESPEQGLLQLGFITTDREIGVERAQAVADGFRATMNAIAAKDRETPTEVEAMLADQITGQQAAIKTLQAQVDEALRSLPAADPVARRQAMLARWESLRSDFAAQRKQLAEAAATVERLKSEPEPTHGLVSSDERREAFDANAALQQDLRELTVNLSELKLQLLNVWQQSSPLLEQLSLAVVALQDVLPIRSADVRGEYIDGRQAWLGDQTVQEAVGEYRGTLDEFVQTWNRNFTSFKTLEVDPLSGEILKTFEQTRRRLGDSLFELGQQRAKLRSTVEAVGEDPSDRARRHVFHSNLIRGLQEVWLAHNRFASVVNSMNTPDNFRLDAALKASRGLRRRSQERIRSIESQLQAQAVRRARQQRLEQLAQAESQRTELQSLSDGTIDKLLALQEELNLGAAASEGFFHAAVEAQAATARLRLAETHLANLQKRLKELVAQRLSKPTDAGVEVIFCRVIGGPIDLDARLRTGGIGAAASFLMVLLGRGRLGRRS